MSANPGSIPTKHIDMEVPVSFKRPSCDVWDSVWDFLLGHLLGVSHHKRSGARSVGEITSWDYLSDIFCSGPELPFVECRDVSKLENDPSVRIV